MALQPAMAAPKFKGTAVIKGQFKEISLDDYKGKYVVLFFYPKDETPGCTAEACSFRDSYEDFANNETEVIGISSDGKSSHQSFIAKHNLNFNDNFN